MSAGLAISAFMPSITSSGIFSSRRANKGLDAMNSNPFVGAMNLDIAGGQVLNAAKGATGIAKEYKNSVAQGIVSAEESIKNLAKEGKVLKGFGKVLSFTADNINPIICATGAIKVACAKDKTDAALEEGCALGTMFAFEGGAKAILGMPKSMKFNKDTMEIAADGIYKTIDGKRELVAKAGEYKLNGDKLTVARKGLYKKNVFAEKQVNAFKDFCATKTLFGKSIKFVPGVAKGLCFVGASISGYALGNSASKIIRGTKEEAKKSA